jgi:hypothetical protein
MGNLPSEQVDDESTGRTAEVNRENPERWDVEDADRPYFVGKAELGWALCEPTLRSSGDYDLRHVDESPFMNLGDP